MISHGLDDLPVSTNRWQLASHLAVLLRLLLLECKHKQNFYAIARRDFFYHSARSGSLRE